MWRQDFPLIAEGPTVYLDSAATAQKPAMVIEALAHFYQQRNATTHRGIYHLAAEATEAYEKARHTVAKFIGAQSDNIVFVKGATEAINLVASGMQQHVQAGDVIALTRMEHHSNIVPWYELARATGARLEVIEITSEYQLDPEDLKRVLDLKPKLLALTHMSNVLGTVNPVEDIIKQARAVGATVLIDGAQAVPHLKVDFQALDADFYVFSGHKLFGPTGIGVLVAKQDWIDRLPPYQGGGQMIEQVSFEHITYQKGVHKLEAGTPHVAGVIGLGAAIEYLNTLDWQAVSEHEHDLTQYALSQLATLPAIRIFAHQPTAVISFAFDDIHAHDLATILDQHHIAARAGHHCCMPLMTWLKTPATLRVSLALYNTREDIDALMVALQQAKALFA